MSLKAIPVLFLCILAGIKIILIIVSFNVFDFLIWCINTIMVGWMEWAFWRDRDLPVATGFFKYKEKGKNIDRIVCALTMLGLYFFYTIVG